MRSAPPSSATNTNSVKRLIIFSIPLDSAAPPMSVMNARRLVCRERSIVRGDEGRIMTRPSSRPEARRRLGCQTANELGAPVASSIPEQLPGHQPASARMGYEDGHALFLRYRRVEGPLGRGGAA